MKTVGQFTMGGNKEEVILGYAIADKLIEDAKNDKISINDDIFKHFLPCIFNEGNFEFLKVIAEKVYPDTRKEIIIDFLDLVWQMTEEGQKEMEEKMRSRL